MRRTALLGLALMAAGPAIGASVDPVQLFRDMEAAFRSGEFDAVSARFDMTMQHAMPPAALAQVRGQLFGQAGALQQCAAPTVSAEAGGSLMQGTCTFEHARLDMRVAIKDGLISGLWFVPAAAAAETPDAASDAAAAVERDVAIGSGDWVLPGTLTLPEGAGPFPAVVLVHGSGPQDRDERIGPNRPFRDLAHGLAARGIAVLRYDKRSLAHGARMASLKTLTVDEETVDDAVLAVRLLRDMDGIDPQRVYVAGHSLGGMLAPRIARDEPAVAGLVILAGNSRPLQHLVLEQVDHLSKTADAATRAQLDAMRREAERIAHVTADTPGPIFGAPASYWVDLAGYDPTAVARALPQPILVLQGGRDYQVTQRDFDGWQRALADRPAAAFRRYPALNHLFVAGEGVSTPQEYLQPGRVDDAVIADIAAFIGGVAPARAPGGG